MTQSDSKNRGFFESRQSTVESSQRTALSVCSRCCELQSLHTLQTARKLLRNGMGRAMQTAVPGSRATNPGMWLWHIRSKSDSSNGSVIRWMPWRLSCCQHKRGSMNFAWTCCRANPKSYLYGWKCLHALRGILTWNALCVDLRTARQMWSHNIYTVALYMLCRDL